VAENHKINKPGIINTWKKSRAGGRKPQNSTRNPGDGRDGADDFNKRIEKPTHIFSPAHKDSQRDPDHQSGAITKENLHKAVKKMPE
jgi:hypothetical protein